MKKIIHADAESNSLNLKMDHYQETFNTWNNVAALYQEKFMDLDLYNATYDFICTVVTKPNAKVLEIGCGPGNISKYLLSKRPDFDILGIDIAPNMIELAKKNNPTAHFTVMDGRQINKLESKFDVIIGGFCLPYFSQTESDQLIKDAYNLLNENGLIYLSFVEGDEQQSGFKVGSGGRVFFNYYDLNKLTAQLINEKFSETEVFKVKYPTSKAEFDIHTILVAKKHANKLTFTNDKKYWDQRWIDHSTGWDLSGVSPAIKEYIDQLNDKQLKILIPGCGNAYEAEYLLQNGFTNITVIDISPTLANNLKSKFIGKPIQVICGDFFQHIGKYDLIIEQTFFCAIDPSLRNKYVEKSHALLNANGRIAGLLFNTTFDKEGPPFGGSKEEYLPLFQSKFKIVKMETCTNSVKPRIGTEISIELLKRGQ